MKNLYKIFVILIIAGVFSPATSVAQWVQTNGPYGDDIRQFAVSGTNLFASAYYGVYLSTNNGTSWTATGLPGAITTGSFAVYPNGAGDTIILVSTDSGFYRTTDNGTSWTKMNLILKNVSDYEFASNGLGASYIFASTRMGDSGGVFLSTDYGDTWTAAADSGLNYKNSTAVAGLLPIPANGGTGVINLFAVVDDPIWYYGGIFLSTNNGTSWTEVDSGLPNITVVSLIGFPNDTGGTNLFLGTAGQGIFLSTNNGTSWTAVDSGLPYLGLFDLWGFPNGEGGTTLFASTYVSLEGFPDAPSYPGGIFTSTNNGKSWTYVGLKERVYITAFDEISDGEGGTTLFAGGPGVSRSTDNGATWSYSSSGMAHADVSHLTMSPNQAGGMNLFAASDGVFLSTNNGTSWVEIDSGLANTNVTALAAFPNGSGGTNLLAGMMRSGVCLSTNNGTSWKTINSGLPDVGVWSLGVCPNGGGETKLFAGTDNGYGVYVSANNGTSWTPVNTGMPNYGRVEAFAVSNTNIVAGEDVGTVLSSDCGVNWRITGSTSIYSFVVSPNGKGGTNLFAGGDGLFLSTDNGESWTDLNADLSTVYTLAVSPTSDSTAGTNLFAGTSKGGGGVFLSTNNGTSWTEINPGSQFGGASSLIVSSDGGSDTNLFAGTAQGVWRWSLSQVGTYSAINLSAVGIIDTGNARSISRHPLSGSIKSSQYSHIASAGNGQIMLHWSKDNHPNFLRYRIYGDTVPHRFSIIDSTMGAVTDTTEIIRGLANGRTYYFRITAVDGEGINNDYSNEVAVIGTFSSTPILTAIPGDGQVLLHWSMDNPPGFMRYRIYQDTLPNPTTVIDSTTGGVTDTSKVIHGLTNHMRYYFRITVVDNGGIERDSSNNVAATPGSITLSLAVNDRWNMLSVPLSLTDYRKSILFSSAISNGFFYNGGYVIKDTLAEGCGYWLKFSGNQYILLVGNPCTQDTIDVREGWNMIGSLSTPIAVSNITSNPDGIETSKFFAYANGYSTSDSIHPGQGYWVKVNQDGKLILASSTNALSVTKRIRIVPTDELPPAAPDGNEATNIIPKIYALEQNYPNPFNPTTIIRYDLPKDSYVRLTVYDVLGREVIRLVDELQQAGSKSVGFNAVNLPSGLYFIRLNAGTFSDVKKMLLVK